MKFPRARSPRGLVEVEILERTKAASIFSQVRIIFFFNGKGLSPWALGANNNTMKISSNSPFTTSIDSSSSKTDLKVLKISTYLDGVQRISEFASPFPLSHWRFLETCRSKPPMFLEKHTFFVTTYLGGGFKYFLFSPLFWGNDPIWRAFFSDGLKPPTSYYLGHLHPTFSSLIGNSYMRIYPQPWDPCIFNIIYLHLAYLYGKCRP